VCGFVCERLCMARVALVTVHGIGSQDELYADSFFEAVRGRLDESDELECFPCLWQPAVECRQSSAADSFVRSGATWNSLRGLIVRYGGDVMAYQIPSAVGGGRGVSSESNSYAQMHKLLDATLSEAEAWMGDGGQLVLVAHSLGTVLVSNFIWDATHPGSVGNLLHEASASSRRALVRMSTLFTLGSPLAMWSLRWPLGGHPIAVRRWVNIWCPSDPIGCPLKSINERYASAEHIEDVRMYVGGVIARWTPLSHILYMDDRKVVGRVVAAVKDSGAVGIRR
jgi:hypothetical protein